MNDVHSGTRGKVSEVRELPREKNGARYGNVGDSPIDTITVSALGGHHHFSRKAHLGQPLLDPLKGCGSLYV